MLIVFLEGSKSARIEKWLKKSYNLGKRYQSPLEEMNCYVNERSITSFSAYLLNGYHATTWALNSSDIKIDKY